MIVTVISNRMLAMTLAGGTLAGGAAAWLFLAPRRLRAAGPRPRRAVERVGPDRRKALRQLCREASIALDAHVAVLASNGVEPEVIAGAPAKPQLEVFDRIAAGWAVSHRIPTGRGTGIMTASDWQFRPIARDGMLCGLVAIAGRRGRPPVPAHQQGAVNQILRQFESAFADTAEPRPRSGGSHAASGV